MDVDETKVAKLAGGEVPFYEPGLPELLRKALDSGRLRFTTSYEEVAEFGDVHFVCVGTPQSKDSYAADMTYVDVGLRHAGPAADPAGPGGRQVDGAGRHGGADGCAGGGAGSRPVPPEASRSRGTRSSCARASRSRTPSRPDRLVFGVHSERAEQALRAAFAPVIEAGCPVVVTDFATAELVKVAANSFLATKISFINAMAEVCEVVRRRRDQAVRGARLRHPDRQALPARRARLRRRLPAQGHPRVHGPGRGAGRPGRAGLPRARSTGSTSGAAPAWSTSAGSCSAATSPASRCASGAPPSSPTPTTSATRPRWTWPPRCRSSAPR